MTPQYTPTRMDNMNIWDIDTKVGCWIDGSHWSPADLDKAVVLLTADRYGYKIHPPTPQTEDDWYYESQDALDYLNSLCPHGYWFYVEDNSLYLGSEDE